MRTKPSSILLLSAAVILVMVFGCALNGYALQMGGSIQDRALKSMLNPQL